MISFNDFLKNRIYSEHFIQRGVLPLTHDDDGDYLSQFPPSYHIQALMYRYNEALKAAVVINRGREMIKSGWKDTENVILNKTRRGAASELREKEYPNMHETKYRQILFANTRLEIPRLLEKLHRFDFEVESMKPLHYKTVAGVISKWRRSGVENYGNFTPMSQSKAMNNYNHYETSVKQKWDRLKNDIVEMATNSCNLEIEKMKNPKHAYHLNYHYWEEHFEDLVHSAISYVHRRLKDVDEGKNVEKQIRRLVSTAIQTRTQQGYTSRKMITSFRNTTNALADKPWPGTDPNDRKADNFSNFIASMERPNDKGWQGTSGKAFANLQAKIEDRPLNPRTGYLTPGVRKLSKPLREPRLKAISIGKLPKTYTPTSIAAQTSID